VRSYCPISNLSVISKLQEWLVAGRLKAYLTSYGVMSLQSAFRANHSTETAMLLVLSDVLRALDRGDLMSLTLHDLSAALDTVNHPTLLRRLEVAYGTRGSALSRFASERSYAVRPCRNNQLAANQTAIRRPSGLSPWLHPVPAFLEDIAEWTTAHHLQLNAGKTGVLLCCSRRRMRHLPTQPLVVRGNVVTLASVVRDLGMWIDKVVPRHRDRRWLFRCSASVAWSAEVTVARVAHEFCHGPRAVAARLL
jgi:hypothetical protein